MKDLFGKAILDFQTNNSPEDLVTETNISEADEMSVEYLFRSFNEMPELEQKAFQLAKGNVLDVGCGAGSHTLELQNERKLDVTAIDISENAVTQANRNAALNKLDHIVKFEAMNAFDVLKNWGKEGRKYDVVMLDPPAFTKSRSSIEKAVTGYKEINLRGMKMINNGGFLVTSSCTNLVSPELFLDTIYMAAKDAKKRIRQVTYQSQSSDHPIIWGMENTHYLKFLIVEVCDK